MQKSTGKYRFSVLLFANLGIFCPNFVFLDWLSIPVRAGFMKEVFLDNLLMFHVK